MQHKLVIATGLGIVYLAADIAFNGLTVMTHITDGKVPSFTNNEYIDTPFTALGIALLVLACVVYCVGLVGPKSKEGHIDGMPVDTAMHDSLFGVTYQD